MGTEASELLQRALQLSEAERADLAAQLIDSLDSDADSEVEKAWDEEISRRLHELDSGKVKAIPWDKARRMILGEADGPSHR